MERTTSDTDVSISNSSNERLLRRLNESEDKTRHFFREGASLPLGITLSTILSKAREEVVEPAHKQSAQPSS